MQQRALGGSAAHIKVGEIGYGLMGLTWGKTIPDEEAFAAMKAAIDGGATFWNAGVFYGRGPQGEPVNLHLIARFFTKYPELADKVFLSVKGGITLQFQVDSTEAFLREDVDGILKALDGKKRLDMFECSRVDPNIPIETTMEILGKLINEGKFNHIGLSECSASTIRRAAKIQPIATVEIEYSLWSIEAKTNGVLQACQDLNIAVIAYSPLGRGILAGKWSTPDDVPAHIRQNMPRYSDENFETNRKFVTFLQGIAERKGVTTAQIAIAWVLTVGENMIPIPGATAVTRVEENMGAAAVTLTPDELNEINQFAETTEAKGDRYGERYQKHLWG